MKILYCSPKTLDVIDNKITEYEDAFDSIMSLEDAHSDLEQFSYDMIERYETIFYFTGKNTDLDGVMIIGDRIHEFTADNFEILNTLVEDWDKVKDPTDNRSLEILFYRVWDKGYLTHIYDPTDSNQRNDFIDKILPILDIHLD